MYGKPFVRPKKTSRFFVSHFFAGRHLHAPIDDIDLVELCVADMTAHIHRVGIAAHLRLRLADGCRHLGIGGRAFD